MQNKCVSGKKIFSTAEIAEDVLIELWSKNEYKPGSGPIAIYKCEDCGYYHFTSREPMNEKLKQALSGGSIKLQREANKWLDRLKHR